MGILDLGFRILDRMFWPLESNDDPILKELKKLFGSNRSVSLKPYQFDGRLP